VLAGDLTALEVERVAVAVAGRFAKHAHMAVLFQPPQLDVVGNVAPQEIPANATPRRPFRPQRAGMQALDRGVAKLVLLEPRVQHLDVGVGITNRLGIRTVFAGGRVASPQSHRRGGSASHRQERPAAR